MSPPFIMSCSSCHAQLKSAKPITPGVKVRCPKCGAVFLAGTEEAPAEAAPRPKARSQPPEAEARFAKKEDVLDRPMDDEDLEEAPEKPVKKFRKKRKARRSWSPALLIGLAVLGVLLLGGGTWLAIEYFLYYGVNRGTGDELPLAYIPGNSNLIVAIDLERAMQQPELKRAFTQNLAQGPNKTFLDDCKRETGLEFEVVFSHILFATKLANLGAFNSFRGQPDMTVVGHSREPFDQRKLARACKGTVVKKAHGKAYYEIHDPANPTLKYLFMPSDRIIVLTSQPEPTLESLIGSGGKTLQVSADTAAIARGLESAQFWLAAPVTGPLQEALQQQLETAKAMPAPPEQKALLEALPKAKACGLSGRLEGENVQLSAAIACADDAAAKSLSEGLQASWEKNVKGFGATVQLKLMLAALPASTRPAIQEMLDSAKFESKGPVAQASVQLGLQNLKQLGELGAMAPPAAMPGRPPGMPGRPPGMPPPRRGRPGMPPGKGPG